MIEGCKLVGSSAHQYIPKGPNNSVANTFGTQISTKPLLYLHMYYMCIYIYIHIQQYLDLLGIALQGCWVSRFRTDSKSMPLPEGAGILSRPKHTFTDVRAMIASVQVRRT